MYLTHPQYHDPLRLLDGEPGELEARLEDLAVRRFEARPVLAPVAEVRRRPRRVIVAHCDELGGCTYDVCTEGGGGSGLAKF